MRSARPGQWLIRSVTVRARDGAHRLRAAYRLLLTPEAPSQDGSLPLRLEHPDARCDLRPRLDRAPGPRADH